MLVYAYKNSFLDIFPRADFFQAYCTLVVSNMVLELYLEKIKEIYGTFQ